MKLTPDELLSILRLFEQATIADRTASIDHIMRTHPSSINTYVSFRYNGQQWGVLVDDTAEDHEAYIVEEIKKSSPNAAGYLIENPHLPASYGMPFEAKDVYLFRFDDGKVRLDQHLAATRPELSRSSWQKHVAAGRISVDGKIVTSGKQLITKDSRIEANLPTAQTYDEVDFPIIYIDDDVIIINKPVGVLTHRKNQLDDEFTVADFFRRYTTFGLETDRPGIVHRLDRDTSGILVGARNERAYHHLKQQFADRTIKKVYVAVTDGIPNNHELLIDLPIGRNPSRPGTYRVDVNGKSAQTLLTILHKTDSTALVRLRPKTGRTHQLRVHLAHIGTPIFGDRLYHTAADRMYLHAHALALALPNGTENTFTADIPDEFFDISGAVPHA